MPPFAHQLAPDATVAALQTKRRPLLMLESTPDGIASAMATFFAARLNEPVNFETSFMTTLSLPP